MLPRMDATDLAARVLLLDGNGDDVGVAHMPRPVEAGDVAALEQGFPFRVVDVVEFDGVDGVELVAEVEAAPICLTR
jgi:hypothetical protein